MGGLIIHKKCENNNIFGGGGQSHPIVLPRFPTNSPEGAITIMSDGVYIHYVHIVRQYVNFI